MMWLLSGVLLALVPQQITAFDNATPTCFPENHEIVCDTRVGAYFSLSFDLGTARLHARPLWKEQLRRYARDFPRMTFKVYIGLFAEAENKAEETRLFDERLGRVLALARELGISTDRLDTYPQDDERDIRGSTAVACLVPIADRLIPASSKRPLPQPENVDFGLVFVKGSDEIEYEPSWVQRLRELLLEAPGIVFEIQVRVWNLEVGQTDAERVPYTGITPAMRTLARKREERAIRHLVQLGVPRAQIVVKPERPFVGSTLYPTAARKTSITPLDASAK